MRVYLKKGNLNFKERRMVSAVESAISKKLEANPDFQYNTATNFNELEALWSEHCTEEVPFTEVPKNESSEPTSDIDETPEIEDTTDNGNSGVDPFNRDEPIVRDYVKGTDFPGDKIKQSNQNVYGEPQTRFDQMQMPDENGDINLPPGSKGQTTNPGNGPMPPKPEQKSSSGTKSPVNPAFNDMSESKRKSKLNEWQNLLFGWFVPYMKKVLFGGEQWILTKPNYRNCKCPGN